MSSDTRPKGPSETPIAVAMASCRRHLGHAAGFSALINLLYIAPTIYMLQVYDRVIPSRSFPTLAFLTGLLLVSLGTLSALDLLRSRILVRAGARLEKALSASLLRNALDRRSGQSGVQLTREFDQLRQTLTGPGVVALFDVPWTIVYIGLCFVLHPLLGALAVAGSAVLIGLAVASDRATHGRMLESSKASTWSYASQSQSAAAADVVRALGMRETLVARHQQERSTSLRLQAEAGFAAGRFLGLTKFARLALQSLALGTAAYLAIGQHISAGAIFAASLLMSRGLAPIEVVLGSWRPLEEARNTYEKLKTGFGPSELDTPKTLLPAPAGRLLLEDVTVISPRGDRDLLRNVGFALGPGDVMGVVGRSGAGKSTLLRAVVGVAALEAGVVRLDGASLDDWDADRLGRYIGYLPQDVGLLQGTVKQNICRFEDAGQPAEVIDAKVIDAAKACGAHEMILRLPSGYDTVLDWGGRGVSTGQAQRIGLARALYGEPVIVALDEPNSHLDAEGEQGLLRAIASLKARGAVVLVAAHRASILEAMDRLLVLADGSVADVGRRGDVLQRLSGSAPPQQPTQPQTPQREVA